MNPRKLGGLLLALSLVFSLLPASWVQAAEPDYAGHWAEETIDKWLKEGLVSGFPDGTFRPNEGVTRAQIAVLVNAAFGFAEQTEIAFDDVPPGAWYARDIAIAVQAGYLKGYSGREMRPEQPITRQEAATVLARLLNLPADEGAADTYKDPIPEWSKGSVGAVTKAGFMQGYPDGTFQPRRTVTRAEALVILDRVRSRLATVFDQAGVYGPETGTETVQGNVVIASADVTLRNMAITGDLTIAESVGDGDVFLNGITVEGTTTILGGGEDSIHIVNSRLASVAVNKADGAVRIVVSGNSSVATVTVQSGAKIETFELTGEGVGSLVIEAPEGSEIVLDGEFEAVTIASENVVVEVSENTVVKELKVEQPAEVKGQGKIEKAVVQASGVVFEQAPEAIETAPEVEAPVIAPPPPVQPQPPQPQPQPPQPQPTPPPPPPVTPSIPVSGVTVVDAVTVEVTMPELAGAAFTWNGQPVIGAVYSGGKYVLTVPYMVSGASNTLVISAPGYQNHQRTDLKWTDPLTYASIAIDNGSWTKDRVAPKDWSISDDGWISLTNNASPNHDDNNDPKRLYNFQGWHGNKAAVDMQVTTDWRVETEIELTPELMEQDGAMTSIWLNIVGTDGTTLDWSILNFSIDPDNPAAGAKWQWWKSEPGVFHDIPDLPANAGVHKLAIHFSGGMVIQYIDGVKVNQYSLGTDLSAVKDVIFNSYSYGEEYTALWKVPVIKHVEKYPQGAKVIANAAQLKKAVEEQKNGETWFLLNGVYDLKPFASITVLGESGWFFPITANDLTIVGESREGVVLTSTTNVPNGTRSTQNHITVFGDNVTIENLTIKSKVQTNKAIEVLGQNITIRNVDILPNDLAAENDRPTFSGSLFFSPYHATKNPNKNLGTAKLENVRIHGHISTQYTNGGKLTLNNVEIDFRRFPYPDYESFGPFARNANPNDLHIQVQGLTIRVANNLANLQTQVFDRLPEGATVILEPGTYYVPYDLDYPTGVVVEDDGADFVYGIMAGNETELRNALQDPAADTVIVKGTITLEATLFVKRGVRIVGQGSGATITRGTNWVVLGDPNSKGNAMLIHVENVSDPVVLENLTVTGAKDRAMPPQIGGTDYGSGINIYRSGDVRLINVASTHNAAAGVIVNGSRVHATGLRTSGNKWYGVGVSKGSGVTETPSFTLYGSSQLEEDYAIVALKDAEVDAPGYGIYPHPTEPGNVIYSKKPLDLMAVNKAIEEENLAAFAVAVDLFKDTLEISDSVAKFNEMPPGQGRQQAVFAAVSEFIPYENKAIFAGVFGYVVDQEYHKMQFIKDVDGARDETEMQDALKHHVPILRDDRLDLIAMLHELDKHALANYLENDDPYTQALEAVYAILDNEDKLEELAVNLLAGRPYFGVEPIAAAILSILGSGAGE